MTPITDSPIKEAMRQANEQEARQQEYHINTQMNSDISRIAMKKFFPISVCGVLAVIFGVVGVAAGKDFNSFLGGAFVGGIIYLLLNLWIKSKNSGAMARKAAIERDAQRRIQEAYDEADRRTVQQINAYDAEVAQYSQRIMQKPEAVNSMIQRNTDMFQRMISHADSGSNMRFVETDFTYQVVRTGIMYSYQSRYTNPQDDFNFDKQRFRNLNSDTECEGLAQALAKLTIKRMKKLYPTLSSINVRHVDAEVTLHFKMPNSNFVNATDIF